MNHPEDPKISGPGCLETPNAMAPGSYGFSRRSTPENRHHIYVIHYQAYIGLEHNTFTLTIVAGTQRI